jgi:CubicO group peptidase (beta-lactamase class C family)/uncharacterized protein YneR
MRNILFTTLALMIHIIMLGQNKVQKMDELMQAYASLNKFNGTVLVVHDGKTMFQKGYGFRDAATKLSHDTGSIFQVGSLTKQFTAAVIMQLVQEKKLSLKDPLSKYFPGFKNGDKIHIEHLLTHTSGIFNYTNDSMIMNKDVTMHYSQQQIVDIFRNYPPDFEPGEKFNYSNSGYSLLGYIIEKVTKKPYEKVMRERIFQPLGMYHTGFDFAGLSHPKKSKGYFLISSDTIIKAPIVDSTIAHAAGAMYSTVCDLQKWERSIAGNKILTPTSWEAVFTPKKSGYGFGWAVDTSKAKPNQSHSGGIHGFASYIVRYPKENLAVILLDNASSVSLYKIAADLSAIAFGETVAVPQAPKEIAMDASALKDFIGVYQLTPDFSIEVSLDATQLKAKGTGQPAFDIFPKSKDRFFPKMFEAELEFKRDEKGEVVQMILHQNGMAVKGEKQRPSRAAEKKPITELKIYQGEYELAPGFSITIKAEADKLTGQATGQPAFELVHEKNDLFQIKIVDAKIEFIKNEKGEVIEMILYQGGQEIKGTKIK